ncbi:MAG: chaperone modulator CbpM [Wenzhouxiangellaceae bacterium]|nr:chaperone modulator CbpM [Wenzhouxiangellaceae bacterium]
MSPERRYETVDLSEERAVDLDELCSVLRLDVEVVCEWVDEGVLDPKGRRRAEWRFAADQLTRARRARRLQRDLAVNTASLPLVLDLLGEVARLRRMVRGLERRISEE